MELASITSAATNSNSADRRSSDTRKVPSGWIAQSAHLKTAPERSTSALTHNIASAASEPTQAKNAGIRRSGTASPASAPAPQSAKTKTSSDPSVVIKLSRPPGAPARASSHQDAGNTAKTISRARNA